MMPLAMTFYPHERVFTDSPVEAIGLVSIVALLISVTVQGVMAYKHSRCHEHTCRNRLHMRRHGKYPHGHMRLCAVHHPSVPVDGKVTAEHINAETNRKAPPAPGGIAVLDEKLDTLTKAPKPKSTAPGASYATGGNSPTGYDGGARSR